MADSSTDPAGRGLRLLRADGYNVSVVQNPTISLDGDVAATRQVLDAQDGPTVLVGHSYGGAVISEAGNHEKVSALVYVTAFAPDKGESVNTLISDPPPGAPVPPILPPNDGFLLLDRDKFAESFAGDLPADEARFMADSQMPWGVDALGGPVASPAWRSRPTFYLVATDEAVTVESEAMEPTYHPGDRLVIERIDAGEIRRGDVALVDVPDRYQGALVLQRVIGVGGDHVVSGDGDRITVNGKPVEEPYVMRGEVNAGNGPYDVRVPDGRLFLLGDHRVNSNDSRFFLSEQSGSIAASGVHGRVQKDSTVPAMLVVLGILGIVLALAGIGLGIGGCVAGRRARRSLAAVPPWPVA